MNLNETQARIGLITFAVLVGATILLLILDSTGSMDDVTRFAQNPAASVLEWVSTRAERVSNLFTGPEDLQLAEQQIAQLVLQVETLQRENEELREVQGDYQQLLELFNHARETPQFERTTATVIAYDTSPLFRSVIIDRGSEDGVQVGMPVESARGLVGQIYRTTNNAAMVILLTDNISSIPARMGTTRATGIVRGGGLGGAVTMDWVDLEAQVQPGEIVLTSGLGGRFPEDIVIGRVVDIQRSEAELFQTATIQPAVDFDSLEILFVITNFRTIDTSIFDTIQDEGLVNP